MSVPPAGTVTFLFTDVEGSTAWWEAHPRAMDSALALHDEIVRGCIEAHNGYVFSTAGDAFAAAFATAHEALEAAADAQQALAEQTWPPPVTLRVRMALHTGEAIERDGDYFGPPLNRAARLMSVAHPAQILCSEVTARLVEDRVALRDLGLVGLKDLLRPEHIYQPEIPGLAADFPPLVSLDPASHNLPLQPTALLGREAEVRRVLELLAQHRLVTLTGVGGCGKTRLALAAAAELVGEVTDGVFFVELAPVSDPARVAEVIAETLGLSLARGSDRDNVARFVARKDLLLVLDNCEHLLDELAAFVGELLSSAPNARVLVTSREALDIDGEQSHRVSSLSDESALALLLARAREASEEFRLSSTDAPAAAELCRQLDGIPLALELAAAHLAHLSPVELLQRLDSRFELLVGSSRRHRQRQQTLQAVMDWSWDLLTEDERRVLGALSVFVGGWTLEEAEEVCVPASGKSIAHALGSLTAKSLVESRETALGRRYQMLETVRLFASQKLIELGLAERTRRAHRDWFIQWVESTPLDQRLWWVPWIRRNLAELDNLALAFEWSLDHADLSQATTLLVSTTGAMHFSLGKAPAQGLRWAHALLDQDLDNRDRVQVLTAGMVAAVDVGDHGAMEILGAAAEQLVDLAQPSLACFLLSWRATATAIRDPEQASRTFAAASDFADRSGSALARGYVAAWRLHAELCSPEGRNTHRSWIPSDFGGPDSMGWDAAATIAIFHEARLGNLEHAEAILESVYDDSDPLGHMSTRTIVMALAGEPTLAMSSARSVLELADRSSDTDWHAEMVLAIAMSHLRAGDPERALTYLEALRSAPMLYPIFFDLRRDFAERARSQLDEDATARARAPGATLDVESILDVEVRRDPL